MKNKSNIKFFKSLVIAGLIAFVFSGLISPQEKEKQKPKQEIKKDTTKIDTTNLKIKQKEYNLKAAKQMSKIDSLIQQKKKQIK